MKDPKVVRVSGLPVIDPIDERILGSLRRSRRPSRLPTPHQAGVGRKPNAERSLFGSHDENVGTIQVCKRADLVLIALDEVTTLCGPDGPAVV